MMTSLIQKLSAFLFIFAISLLVTTNTLAQNQNHTHNHIQNFYQLPNSNVFSYNQVVDHHFVDIDIKEEFFREVTKYTISNRLQTQQITKYYLTNSYKYTAAYKDRINGTVQLQGNNNTIFTKGDLIKIINDIVPFIISDYNSINNSRIITDVKFSPDKEIKKTPSNKGPGEPCNNPNFEQCDFTGWEMYQGDVNTDPYTMINSTTTNSYCSDVTGTCFNVPPPDPNCDCDLGGGNLTCGNQCSGSSTRNGVCTCTSCPCAIAPQHQIVTPGIDDETNVISKTDPNGGTCTAVLGDWTGTGGRAASIRQTFQVDANSSNFYYSYAAVLQDPPGHNAGEKPFFKVNMYDANGDDIVCGLYSATAGDGQDGWVTINQFGGDIVYKDWTTVFVPLQAYIGQDVTVEFIVGDCSQGGHYGYAYVDVSCNPLELLVGSNVPCGDLTLSAPPGAQSYLWAPTGDTTQTITPTVSGTYSVTITPLTGAGCSITIDTTITLVPRFVNADFTSTTVCLGDSTIFNDLSSATGTTLDTWEWDFDGDGTIDNTTQNPTYIFPTAGTKNTNLTVTSVDGCTSDTTITVIVHDTPLPNFSSTIVCWNQPTVFTNLTTPTTGISSWEWDFNNDGVVDDNTENPTFIFPADGTFPVKLKVTNTKGCSDSITIDATVNYCGPEVILIGDTICIGETGTLTATLSGGTPPYDVIWSGGINLTNNLTTDPSTDTQTDAPLVTTTYKIVMTDANGIKDSTTAEIYVNNLPNVSADTDAAICIGDSIDITASGALTYLWDNNSTNAIRRVSPNAASTTYRVTGTDINGCVNTDSVTITVNPLPVPTTSNDTAICIGESATISTTAIGAPTITYTWDNAPPGAGPHTVSPTNTTTYTVTATDGNGCVGTDVVTVTINQLPIIAITNNTAICIGDSTTISASGGNTYIWDQTPPGTGPGPHVVKPTITTTYNVTVTDNIGCMNSNSVTITVNDLPTPNIGDDQTICNGEETTIITNSGGALPLSYTWNQTPPATGAGPHLVRPNVTTTYIATITDNNGCVNQDTMTINVNPNPIIGAGNDVTICELENTTLTANGGSTYEWKNLTTGAVIANTQVIAVQPIINTCYEVTGTDDNGCSSTDIVCVNVEKIPLPSFDAPAVCDGVSTLFNNTSTGATTYIWNFGDNSPLSNIESPSHTYNGIGNYSVKLIAINDAGCKDSITQQITVNYVPVPLFIGDTLQGCPPLTVNFTNQTDSLDPNFNYFWDLGEGVSTSNKDTVTLEYLNTGVFSISLTITTPEGCSSTFTRPNYITVYPVPIADFEGTPPISDIYNPVINFTDLSIGADIWRWDFGDLTGSAAQNPDHEYTDTGTFIVWLKVANTYGCVDSIQKIIIIKDVYSFYAPNAFTPDGDGTNDIFFPQGHAIDLNTYELFIFDRWGELLHSTNDYYKGWNGFYKGSLVQIDTYIWKVNLKDIYGVSHRYIGKVSIIK